MVYFRIAFLNHSWSLVKNNVLKEEFIQIFCHYLPSCRSKSVYISLCWTLKKIFWRNVDFLGNKYYGSQWRPSTLWLPAFFKSSFFSIFFFNIRKKPTQVWNDVNDQNRTFSFTVPGWWNDLPTPIRNAESLTMFKRHLKTHLFRHLLTSFKKKNNLHSLSLTLLFFP